MKQQKILLVVALIAGLIFPSGITEAEVNQLTVNYLASAQQNAWVTQAIKAAGGNNLDLGYFSYLEIASATDAAKAILALAAAGENPYDYQNVNYHARLTNYYQENQIGSIELVNDDFWGILALISSGERADSAIITDSKNFILHSQNNDGGWGWAPASSSDTNDTAAAIMALLSAGQSGNSAPIQNAVSYLRLMQNNDGGFPFSEGVSDSGSDAWVICALNKLGLNPADWQKNGRNPIEHLQSLMLDDGSFKWVQNDQAGNLIMTAYAAVALSGSFYPVAVYLPEADAGIHKLRIEGRENSICNAQAEGRTVQEVFENGAEICNYNYHIQPTDWGPYLDMINNEQAEGLTGWLYRVNWKQAEVGMADYELEQGDEVLFYFGSWHDFPLRIFLSASQANEGDELTARVEFFNDHDWQAATGTAVFVGDMTYQTNNIGHAVFSAPADGGYMIYAEKQGGVRSEKTVLLVGESSGNGVFLEVEVDGDGQRDEDEEYEGTMAFSVSASNLDFGVLHPGASQERVFTITNQSGTDLYIEGIISGDELFEGNLLLNQKIWENYNAVLERERSAQVSANLVIPQNYRSGRYAANLVIWATSR